MLKNLQLYKFSAYGFLKNLRFFDAFIILFFRQQGFSFLQIGTLISLREISILILEIPTGIFADSFGRRSSMILSFVSYILSFLIFFFLPTFGFYAVAMIFFALGEAYRTGTHKAMILTYLELNNLTDKKVEYYGFTRSWSQLGSAIAALIAGAIVFYSGNYKYIFLGSVIPYLLALGLMLTYPQELDGKISREKMPFMAKTWGLMRNSLSIFVRELKKKSLRKALINSALFDGFYEAVKDYIQPILQSFALAAPLFLSIRNGRDTIIISLVYFCLYLLTSFAARKSSRFSSLFSSLPQAIDRTYLIGIALIIFSSLFLILHLKIVSIILFILFYAFHNTRRPMTVSFVSDQISSELLASGLSLESQLKTLFTAVLSPLMGFFSDRLGIGTALLILSFLTLFAFPLIKVQEKGE
ncbi:MAG TPA: MFS transporter [Candidatus Cloacimonadota bacterium]|nr:MFS transporter [Candidatus Cloacimonadota bacterium]